ncbi:unnamed protein product [Vitrella brassicaformis CCMP3155]|uniref:Uncharacterized protein n=1 Tax=Vitrella brassicaformis (strain CCMP3155) TaxID=1169540 RepID=A0A0G4F6Q8_VITBC|nr:unnamed protein product [Vitrella brassicaformis CCMP3155]|eukprot:CEM08107.1 unnamed protein product [Vitrella brassicaformis CCMP3155]
MMVRAFGREGTNSIGQADLLVSRRGGVVVAVKHQHRVTLMALPTHTQRGVGGVLSVSLVIDPHTTHTNTHTISLVASWRLFHGLISRANAAAANPPKESVCEALLTVMGTGEDECVAASPASMSTGNVLPAPPAIVQRGDKNNTLVRE